MVKKWYYYNESGKHYAILLGIKDGMAYIELETGVKCVGEESILGKTLHPVIESDSPNKSIPSRNTNYSPRQKSKNKKDNSATQNNNSSKAPEFFKEPGKATVYNSDKFEQDKSRPRKTFKPPGCAEPTPKMGYNKYGSYGKW